MDTLTLKPGHFRLDLPALPESVPLAGACAAEAARARGFSPRDCSQGRLAVEEAVCNGVEHAYPPGEPGRIQVAAEGMAGGLRILVRDQGVPLFEFPDSHAQHGLHRMHALTNRVSLHNLGRHGKELELVKLLPRQLPEVPAQAAQPAPEGVELEVRRMRPDETDDVCRCIFEGYGYSYIYEDFYYPERLAELNRSGLITSFVAVAPDGRVVGHAALALERPDCVVGELGMAVVTPAFRRHGLLSRMILPLVEEARARRLVGVFGRAVSVHPDSQHVCHGVGLQDCALLVGHEPETVRFRNIAERLPQRETLVLVALRLDKESTPPTLYLGGRHQEEVEWLLQRAGYEPRWGEPPPPEALPGESEATSTLCAGSNLAILGLRRLGVDAARLVASRLQQLCLRHIDIVQLYLNLRDPGLPALVDPLERLGFFFAGVHPGWEGGDALVMQYLNDVAIDYDLIRLESPESRRLLEYVRRCHEESQGRLLSGI